ncbi:PAS domain-containing protein [Halobacteria archaeon AArc-m2/3/4]|uniref:histidine kinase n=1 Tax=Natronoglomus mannanivorans TaxID=2979990 RepID=A0ABT2QKY0_9EURY|nr:PAS domain-containing protein [Halobacteria archaeon AArc-m2/3/4]
MREEPSRSIPTSVIDRVEDAFFALDTDWRFTYLNDAAQALLERPREELIGRVMWDEFPETVETQFPDGFYHAMDEQVSVSFEVYHLPLDTWLEAQAYPSESGLSVYMRDVTDRKHRETKLAQHGAVVEAIKDGVFTLDRNNRIASINDALERGLGVDREAVVGKHVEAILERADIDTDHAVDIGQAINELDVGNAAHRELEIPYRDASGTDRVGNVRMVPVDDGTAKLAGVVRDITEQREYERIITSLHEVTRWLLQSDDPEEICAIAVHAGSDLLDLPISGVWLLDDEHGYLDPVAGTAGAHDEFGGLPRFRQGEGLVWDVFEAGEAELYDDLREIEGIYNPKTPIRSEIIVPIGTHGVLMTGALEPHRFDESDLDLLSTLAENTRAALDRADRERVLRERTERLERQTERLEAVATVLSEDLDRELTAVADALEERSESGGGATAAGSHSQSEWEFPLAEDTVEETLDRAERLVDDIQEFARNATTVGTRTRVDLETAIETAVEASRIEFASVVVEQSASLRADPERFANMLETIFNDADARATSDVTVQVGLIGFELSGVSGVSGVSRGGVRGSSTSTSADTGDEQGTGFGTDTDAPRGFYLLDDASEIPPSAHDQVLDPAADVSDGIDGLGLAVARAIAEAHGWSVSISNGENGGTRFEVHDVTTLKPV